MINVMGDSFGAAIVNELSKDELAKSPPGSPNHEAPNDQSKLALESDKAEIGDEQVWLCNKLIQNYQKHFVTQYISGITVAVTQ